MLPQELASLAFDKLNVERNKYSTIENKLQIVTNANSAADRFFGDFSELSEAALQRFRDEYQGRYSKQRHNQSMFAKYDTGTETIGFSRPAPELAGMDIPGGYEPWKTTVIRRHLPEGYLLDPGKPTPTWRWCVRTEIDQEPTEDNRKNQHGWDEWLLNGVSFMEFLPGSEEFARLQIADKSRYEQELQRLRLKSTAEIAVGMFATLDEVSVIFDDLSETAARPALRPFAV